MVSTNKKKYIRHLIEFVLVATVAVYILPAAKQAFFPTQMDRLEKILRNSTLEGYHLAVDRKDDLEIILTVFDGGKSISARIYRDVLRELDPVGDSRAFFTHAINRNADKVFYLSRILMETDEDFKKLKRLEVTICGHIKNQSGNVRYNGHEPIYECEVPIQKITTSARE